MFEALAPALFAIFVLGIWAKSDLKTGYVHNVALVIPVVIAFIFNIMRFITIFVPVFLMLVMLFYVVRKKGFIGFADVVGLPFVLLYLADIGVFGIAIFTVVFAVLVLRVSNERYDVKLKQNVYNRIPLMPVLFLSYFAGFVVHLVFALIV